MDCCQLIDLLLPHSITRFARMGYGRHAFKMRLYSGNSDKQQLEGAHKLTEVGSFIGIDHFPVHFELLCLKLVVNASFHFTMLGIINSMSMMCENLL